MHIVDVFPTVAEIAGVNWSGLVSADRSTPLVIDGQSLIPYLQDPQTASARTYLYTEQFQPGGAPPYPEHDRMVRDADWKLIRFEEGEVVEEAFFRLAAGAWDEGQDLLETGSLSVDQEAVYARLSQELDALSDHLSYDP